MFRFLVIYPESSNKTKIIQQNIQVLISFYPVPSQIVWVILTHMVTMGTKIIYNLCTIWTLVTMGRKILGTSNLSGTHSLKATIIRDVVAKLNLKTGDKIVYIEEDGRIFIEKA